MNLLFCGDISFSRIKEFNFSQDLIDLFQSMDFVIGNLESVVTESTNKLPLHPVHLNTDKIQLPNISFFNILSLANNHILDYQIDGIKDTQSILDVYNIRYFGAGVNSNEANQTLAINSRGLKLAFVPFTRFSNASSNSPGAADNNLRRVKHEIKRLKSDNYFIVVMPHWGYEHISIASQHQRILAKKMINWGADIIIGSHPHIHQGYEPLNNKYAFYSLGNFVFSSSFFKNITNHKWKLNYSFMVKIEISKNLSYSVNLIPYYTSDCEVRFLTDNEHNMLLSDVNDVNSYYIGKVSRYLKKYYSEIADFVEFNKKVTKSQFSKKNAKYSRYARYKKLISLYSKANWQDLANRFNRLILLCLR